MDLGYYRDTLARAGVSFEPGLGEAEVKHFEDRYQFTYPPDLREFLMFAGLSSGRGWSRTMLRCLLNDASNVTDSHFRSYGVDRPSSSVVDLIFDGGPQFAGSL
jgi:hypothetical protein